MRHGFIFAIGLCLALATSGAAEIPKGRVLEKVACAAEPGQTYALYVPTTFDAARKWPVLFCFDAMARGKLPVERFQAAAEKFGYIVAGSNHSRNGPWEDNVAAASAMMADVSKYFPIDPERIYLTGVSGGARVSCQLALSGAKVRGVVACAAGFMGSEAPSKVPFAFFGTAGITDFNYCEMRRTDRELDERKAPHRVVIFPGGHEWLPSELAVEALAWLDLQAMRAGVLARDPAWLEAQFQERQRTLPSSPMGERYLALKSLVDDFKDLLDVSAFERELAGLASSREVREWRKAERTLEKREAMLSTKLLEAIHGGFMTDARKQIAELQAKASGSTDASEKQMVVRVLHGVHSGCGDVARGLMRAEDYAAAVPLWEIMTALRPDSSGTYFELARAQAGLKKPDRALAALENAVAAGYKNLARLEQEPAFAPLRTDPAFQALLERMK